MPRNYVRKSNRGVDASRLLAAIKEVKDQNRPPYTVSGSFGITYNSFKRYLKRFSEKVPDISMATEEELEEVAKDISSYKKPKVRNSVFSVVFNSFCCCARSFTCVPLFYFA